MSNPLSYENVKVLLEYLDTHSYTPRAVYELKISSISGQQPEHIYSIGSVEPTIFKMKVQGLVNIRRVSERQGTSILRIGWSNRDSTIAIDMLERTLHIKTASLSFVEICRHKLTGQNVSKITVDLKPC
jgi:hypothetical protein